MSILERTVWVDTSVDLYIGELIEYDMREGGFSIIQKENLLPDKVIQNMRSMTKDERHVFIGKLAYDKNFRHIPKLVTEKFKPYRLLFGDMNDLIDEDIFYVRKDAICVKRYCYNTKIDEFIEFREKRAYGCFMRLIPTYWEPDEIKPNKLEFYWCPDTDELDIKGMKNDIAMVHEDGIYQIIKKFMRYLYDLNYDGALKYIVGVMDAYKHNYGVKKGCTHPEKYYRRFDREGKYKLWKDGYVLNVCDIGEELIPMCDKIYNYRNILVPMMNFVSR